jgi:hypothetical protein
MKLRLIIGTIVAALCLTATASAFVPDGYKKAGPRAKAVMDGVATSASGPFRLKKTFAWLIDQSDGSFGVVCGYHHRKVSGDALHRSGGGWELITDSSGATQNAYAVCNQY